MNKEPGRRRLPTLTDALDPLAASTGPGELDEALPPDEQRLTTAVLAEVLRRSDQLLEYRLREALTPLLEKVMAQVVADARHELAAVLRDVITRAVSQEMARRRSPRPGTTGPGASTDAGTVASSDGPALGQGPSSSGSA